MTRRLIEKIIDGEPRYIWFENNEVISPAEGHKTLEDAKAFILDYDSYTGEERRFRPAERRWKERRKRVSYHDRRQTAGRRAMDQIRYHQNKHR